ncbi:hypothetical protein BTVI_116586 [Pitangus sulphuratus]|nr:hypothetical protein BTVI_116586 [Pitangus sulphuratus]
MNMARKDVMPKARVFREVAPAVEISSLISCYPLSIPVLKVVLIVKILKNGPVLITVKKQMSLSIRFSGIQVILELITSLPVGSENRGGHWIFSDDRRKAEDAGAGRFPGVAMQFISHLDIAVFAAIHGVQRCPGDFGGTAKRNANKENRA